MKILLLVTLILSVLSLVISQSAILSPSVQIAAANIDYIILGLIIIDIVLSYKRERYIRIFLKRNIVSLILSVVFVVLLLYSRLSTLIA